MDFIQTKSQDQNPDAPQPTQDAASNSETVPDDSDAVSATGTVNISRAYSKLNEAVRQLLDSLGIPRTASIPHLAGQNMAEHIEAVGTAVRQAGGVGSSLLTATHSMHDAAGGSTTGHRTEKAAETVIPANSEVAKAAIAAEKSFIAKCKFLLGDSPEVQAAENLIALVGKYHMEGMTALDAAVGLLGIPGPMIQKIAQLHSEKKHGRIHPVLTAPKVS